MTTLLVYELDGTTTTYIVTSGWSEVMSGGVVVQVKFTGRKQGESGDGTVTLNVGPGSARGWNVKTT